jgi:hypothetical protein
MIEILRFIGCEKMSIRKMFRYKNLIYTYTCEITSSTKNKPTVRILRIKTKVKANRRRKQKKEKELGWLVYSQFVVSILGVV